MEPKLQKGNHILIFNPKLRQLVAYGVFSHLNEEEDVVTIISYVPKAWIKYGKTYSKDFGFILLNDFSCLRVVDTIIKHFKK